eukprot:198383-Alexandrium_andersonii.AAC.1
MERSASRAPRKARGRSPDPAAGEAHPARPPRGVPGRWSQQAAEANWAAFARAVQASREDEGPEGF